MGAQDGRQQWGSHTFAKAADNVKTTIGKFAQYGNGSAQPVKFTQALLKDAGKGSALGAVFDQAPGDDLVLEQKAVLLDLVKRLVATGGFLGGFNQHIRDARHGAGNDNDTGSRGRGTGGGLFGRFLRNNFGDLGKSIGAADRCTAEFHNNHGATPEKELIKNPPRRAGERDQASLQS
jgi:hypothetical protein